jgi:hypothetical protein
MKDFANFIAEDKDPNEYDNEGEMAKSQLRTVMSAAEDLMNLLDDEDNLPEWAQGKITKAVDYLDSVRDYMTSEAQDDVEESVDLDEQFEEAFDYFLTDEDIDEAIVESIKIPTDIAKKIPGVKGMLYKKALRYYLDWRKKNPGQGHQGLVKVAKLLRVDPKELNILLHNLVVKGKLPKHLAVTDIDVPYGRYKHDQKVGFLQR